MVDMVPGLRDAGQKALITFVKSITDEIESSLLHCPVRPIASELMNSLVICTHGLGQHFVSGRILYPKYRGPLSDNFKMLERSYAALRLQHHDGSSCFTSTRNPNEYDAAADGMAIPL